MHILHQIACIEQLLKKVTKEDWDNPTPYIVGEYPALVQAKMRAALLSPQPFPSLLDKRGYNENEQRVPKGNGRPSGRWVSTDGVTSADLKNPRFKGMDRTQIKKQKFVDAHLADAEKGAKQLNVPVENLLALSALESGWGRGDGVIIDKGNNFFGLQHPAAFETGFRPAHDNPKAQVAQFDSYFDSMRSFIEDYGYIVKGVSDPTTFASNLQNSGKFGIRSNGVKVADYVPNMVGTITHINSAIDYTRRSKK